MTWSNDLKLRYIKYLSLVKANLMVKRKVKVGGRVRVVLEPPLTSSQESIVTFSGIWQASC